MDNVKGLKIITGMSYEEYISLPESDIAINGIYLLSNGMMFSRGNKFGNDILVVDDFPVSPIPQIIYVHKTTREQKMWLDGQWYVLKEDYIPISNIEIDKILNSIL